MSSLVDIALVAGITGIALLVVFGRTGIKVFGFWGQMLIAVSFYLISSVLVWGGSYFMGGGFAFAGVWQIVILLKNRVKTSGQV